MKKFPMILALTGTLIAASAFARPQQMDPNMPGMASMAGMQHAPTPAEVQGVGVVKAIDNSAGTITLQYEMIKAIGWPATTKTFKIASPKLLKTAKVGDTVQFTLHPAGVDSTVTSIKPAQP